MSWYRLLLVIAPMGVLFVAPQLVRMRLDLPEWTAGPFFAVGWILADVWQFRSSLRDLIHPVGLLLFLGLMWFLLGDLLGLSPNVAGYGAIAATLLLAVVVAIVRRPHNWGADSSPRTNENCH